MYTCLKAFFPSIDFTAEENKKMLTSFFSDAVAVMRLMCD